MGSSGGSCVFNLGASDHVLPVARLIFYMTGEETHQQVTEAPNEEPRSPLFHSEAV